MPSSKKSSRSKATSVGGLFLLRDARSFSGHYCIDEDVLREDGVTDFARYRAADIREEDLLPDFFI